MSISVIFGILMLAGVAGVGWLLARFLLGAGTELDRLSLAFPLGAGMFTWLLFVASWMGVALNLTLVILVLLLLLGFSTLLSVQGLRNKDSRPELARRRADPSLGWLAPRAPLALLALLVFVAAIIAIGVGYSTWDAIAIWSIKGYGIALSGSILDASYWGAHRSAYPLNIPLLISSARLVSGDLLPESKIVFPVFWASTLVGIYSFWRGRKVGRLLAGLGTLFLATIPEIFFHGTIGYANIPLAAYIVLGALWGIVGIESADKRALILSGILLGFGAWTRVEGILFSVSVIVALLAAWRISKQGRIHLGAWLTPFAIIAGAWMVFFRLFGAAGSQASGALGEAFRSIPAGDLGIDGLLVIARYFAGRSIDLGRWGLLFPISLALILLNWKRLSPRNYPVSFALLLCTTLTGAATVALYYIGSYISPDLAGWLSRSFPRAFFQSAYLLGALAVLVSSESMLQRRGISGDATDLADY